jgi:hypothetical protein
VNLRQTSCHCTRTQLPLLAQGQSLSRRHAAFDMLFLAWQVTARDATSLPRRALPQPALRTPPTHVCDVCPNAFCVNYQNAAHAAFARHSSKLRPGACSLRVHLLVSCAAATRRHRLHIAATRTRLTRTRTRSWKTSRRGLQQGNFCDVACRWPSVVVTCMPRQARRWAGMNGMSTELTSVFSSRNTRSQRGTCCSSAVDTHTRQHSRACMRGGHRHRAACKTSLFYVHVIFFIANSCSGILNRHNINVARCNHAAPLGGAQRSVALFQCMHVLDVSMHCCVQLSQFRHQPALLFAIQLSHHASTMSLDVQCTFLRQQHIALVHDICTKTAICSFDALLP